MPYVDPNQIAQSQDLGATLMGQAVKPQGAPLANLLLGLAGGLHGRQARKGTEANQAYNQEFLSNLPEDPAALSRYLLGSQNPDMQQAGVSLLGKQPTALDMYKALPNDVKSYQYFQGQGDGGQPGQMPGYVSDKFKSKAQIEGEKTQAKEEAKATQERVGRAEGAKSFLQKVQRVREFINAGGNPDDLFGPFQGGPVGRFFGGMAGSDAERKRTALQAMLRDLELDLVRFKMKGQGQITEAERAIARETLPQLTNMDAASALQILDGLSSEAQSTIDTGAGMPQPSGTPPPQAIPDGTIVYDPQGRPHVIQNGQAVPQ